jgi:hypothetical protein
VADNQVTSFLNTGSTYLSAGFYNPLHDYASYNYVFTLSVLTKDQYNDPSYLQSSPNLERVIFKTSGKGTAGITPEELATYSNDGNPVSQASINNPNNYDGGNGTAVQVDSNANLQSLIQDFNENGTGRFDLYVESFECNGPWKLIEGATVVQFNMTIVEPLSMNGLLESVRVNCLAAGYEDHIGVPMCLKIEFWGWNATTGKAEHVPNAERYFTVNLQSVEITADERGTSYRCGLVNMQAPQLGMDADIPVTMKMVGQTVGDVLTDLLSNVEAEKKKSNDADNADIYNSYNIEFEPMNAPGGDDSGIQGIETAHINEWLKSNQIFQFADPTDSTSKNNYKFVDKKIDEVRYDPKNEIVSVKSGTKIMDVIEVVIRDSQYVKQFIDKKDEWKTKYNGKIPWFRVWCTTKLKDTVNPKEGRPTYNILYKVMPYWIHYSQLPEEFGDWDPDPIKETLSRTYNYIYTGKNVDLLEFHINLNNLFIQSRPFKLGDQDRSATSLAASPAGTQKLSASDQPKKDPSNQRNVAPVIAGTVSDPLPYGMAGKAIQMDPFQALAHAIQRQIVDNQAMQSMTCKIIGDPYYLVTSGLGNVIQDLDSESRTKNGEAPWLGGAVYISIDFRNPRDYRADGFMDFGLDTVDQYSGIFQVTYVTSTFRDGEFIQNLTLTRLPGQQPSKKITPSIPFNQESKLGESKTDDTSKAQKYGAKKAQSDLTKLLNPKIPSLGLPGLIGGVTGLANAATNALQSSVKRIDAAVNEGLGLISSIVVPLEQVALAAVQIGGIVQVADALLNGQTGGTQLGQSATGYNPYSSGIPLQTTTIPAPDSIAQNQANQAAQANIISSFVQDSSNLYTLETNYANNVITAGGNNYITNPSDPSNLNNVGQNVIAAINGTPTDPSAIAAQLGIDPAQFAGLSADQQSSLIAQLQKVFAKVPTDANIQGFQALGLSLKNITGAGIPNLPALQALTTAPLANVSQYDLQKILASGGSLANLPGASGFASIGALIALLNSKPSNGSSAGNPLSTQQQIDKFSTAAALNIASLNTPGVDPATQGLGSVESNISNAVYTVQGYGGYYVEEVTANSQYGTQRQLSPLDKLMLTKK